MTVQELINKLEKISNKNAEIRVKNGLLIVLDRIIYDNGDDLK